ncbi:MAG: hypothetical protein IJ733_08475, partial [Lachnospiraceae bacterium]|nr:hypothetical protein [Lachnospiraceae bacterium]
MKNQKKNLHGMQILTRTGQAGRRLLCILLSMAMLSSIANVNLKQEPIRTAKAASYQVTQTEINHFFGQSAIIGNSVGLGLKHFFDTTKKGDLGNPTMLVQGSYSFLADFNRNKQFMIHYKGRAMKAKDAVKVSKAKHVFINMGVNDFNTSKDKIFTNYKKYINEIKGTNPNVDFYILATTPTWKAKGRINNKEINKLNKKMKAYAAGHKDIYYIDINTPLRGADGKLKESYVSDGFLHLRMNAYEIWTKHMVNFVKKQLKVEKKARTLIKTARKKLSEKSYKKAVSAVSALEKSTLKSNLQKKLRTIKKLLQKKKVKASATPKPTKTPSPTKTPIATPPMETPPMETPPMETPPMETPPMETP